MVTRVAATSVGFVNDDTWKAVASAFVDICIVACAPVPGLVRLLRHGEQEQSSS